MTIMTRTLAMRKLRHAFLYVQVIEGEDTSRPCQSPSAQLLLEKYKAVRGPYDFRQTGHNAKCCDRYKRLEVRS